jgi:protein farnesyltransferase/geranylgeranyltransferase type-1 subunit alpha
MVTMLPLTTKLLEDELEDLQLVLIDEPKNYHAWQYRQWLIRKFGSWKTEWILTEEMLKADPWNNSAWNHRIFLINNDEGVDLNMEIPFLERFIRAGAIGNLSILNYLHELVKRAPEDIKQALLAVINIDGSLAEAYQSLFKQH